MAVHISDIKKLLSESKLKATKNRIKILEALQCASRPLSIDELLRDVQNSMDMVTVYRTMKAFVRIGIVYQTDFRNGKAYFEFQRNHHHHIVCASCGVIEHVDVCISEALLRDVKKRVGTFESVHGHMLEFFGVCKKCSLRSARA